MMGGVVAQDTLQIRWPLSHYFTYQWPPSYYDEIDTFRTDIGFWGENEFRSDFAYYMFSADSLTIYGLAACLMSDKEYLGSYSGAVLDTTYNDLYEYLRVYEAGDGELIPLNQVKVHLHVTPVAYYMDWNAYFPYVGYQLQPILPMYECYFTSPVTVVDSFYVGRHFHAHRYVNVNGSTYHTTMDILLATTNPYYISDYFQIQPFAIFDSIPPFYEGDTAYWKWLYFNDKNYGIQHLRDIPLLFPILEPGPDTTSAAGIATDPLQRFTSIIPNPAAETAKVVASTGMNRVEVFNMAGEQIYSKAVDAGGLSATLDVSRWPAGTYIVRIHTPMGITTKKLTVGK